MAGRASGHPTPGPSSGRRPRPGRGLSSAGDPRLRRLSQALRHDRGARRADVRGPDRPDLRVPRGERRGQDDDDADRLGILAADAGARPLGRHATRPTCRARPGATCPRSAGSTRAWRSSISSCSSRRSTACRATSPGRTLAAGSTGSGSPTYAERKAEELSKGNQQKIQFISAILHDPPVLLMDEPFTGLDPVNVALLREAFVELRDAGRTLIFSTHQMETVEAMCESIAIVDHGRLVVGGHAPRGQADQPGGGWSAWRVEGEPAGLAVDRRRRGGPPGRGLTTEIELAPGTEPRDVLAAALAPRRARHPLRGRRAVARADLHRPCRAPARCRGAPRADASVTRGRGLMARTRPAPPERRDRRQTRVPRPRPQQAVPPLDDRADGTRARRGDEPRSRSATSTARRSTRILVISDEEPLALATIATANGILNIPPPGGDLDTWTAPFVIERGLDREAAETELHAGEVDAVIDVQRGPDGRLEVFYRTAGPTDAVRSQLAGFTALSVAIIDWTSSLPPGSDSGRSGRPTSPRRR